MFEIRYTEPAKQDLVAIADYLEREAGETVAAGMIAKIRTRVRKLASTAAGYPVRTSLGPERRAIRIDPYLAYFRIVGEIVYVQRILHQRRDVVVGMFND